MPKRKAMGAYTSNVSRDVEMRLANFGTPLKVFMLCKRSDNLTTITRTSLVIARINLRKLSANNSSLLLNCNFSNLDKPSTIVAMVLPNTVAISALVMSVSSKTSCIKPAQRVSKSIPHFANSMVTEMG